jgi:hypothetical protein
MQYNTLMPKEKNAMSFLSAAFPDVSISATFIHKPDVFSFKLCYIDSEKRQITTSFEKEFFEGFKKIVSMFTEDKYPEEDTDITQEILTPVEHVESNYEYYEDLWDY